ncbi:MAG: hypothetical protein OEZ01_16450 [Candidatus Heimdallarchaeota archaeon]|nr:hypothetical protein [Candidatus Heimdallarchaeota archaeon]
MVWYAGSGAIMWADSRWVKTNPERIRKLPPFVVQKWDEHSDDDNNLTKEQAQFIAMVNEAYQRNKVPVDNTPLVFAVGGGGICYWLAQAAIDAVEAATCGPCALVWP